MRLSSLCKAVSLIEDGDTVPTMSAKLRLSYPSTKSILEALVQMRVLKKIIKVYIPGERFDLMRRVCEFVHKQMNVQSLEAVLSVYAQICDRFMPINDVAYQSGVTYPTTKKVLSCFCEFVETGKRVCPIVRDEQKFRDLCELFDIKPKKPITKEK